MTDQASTTDTTTSTATASDAAVAGEATDAKTVDATVAAETTAAADAAGEADDSTVLGSATTEAGAGDDEGAKTSDAESGKTDDPGAADTVPETYELKVTAKDAEGKDIDVEIDTELLSEATPILKEVGLTNEQANKLAPLIVKAQERAFAKQADEFAVIRADWAKEAQADPEIGGKNWEATKNNAAKALDHFVGPSKKDDAGRETNEFRALLNDSGIGNRKELIRAFSKIGEAIAEDGTFARSEEKAVSKKSREEELYPDDVPKK
jgi:hypothetical protein